MMQLMPDMSLGLSPGSPERCSNTGLSQRSGCRSEAPGSCFPGCSVPLPFSWRPQQVPGVCDAFINMQASL